jgi:hypothetical protein
VKRVNLLGTSHSIQEGVEASDEFGALIADQFVVCEFVVIAEETHKGVKTIAKAFCAENSLPHICIDPDRNERARLNIPTFEQVVFLVVEEFRKEYPEVSLWPQEPNEQSLPLPVWRRYQEVLKDSFRDREAVWLDRILQTDLWPCLCIIGADHYSSFADLLSQSGVLVTEVRQDWKP